MSWKRGRKSRIRPSRRPSGPAVRFVHSATTRLRPRSTQRLVPVNPMCPTAPGGSAPTSRPAELSPSGSPGTRVWNPRAHVLPERRRVTPERGGPVVGPSESPRTCSLVEDGPTEYSDVGRRSEQAGMAPDTVHDPGVVVVDLAHGRGPRRERLPESLLPRGRLPGPRSPRRRDDEAARWVGDRSDRGHPGLARRQAMKARAQPERLRDALGDESVQGSPGHLRQDFAKHDEPDVAVDVLGARPRGCGWCHRQGTGHDRGPRRLTDVRRAVGIQQPRRGSENRREKWEEGRQPCAMGQEVRHPGSGLAGGGLRQNLGHRRLGADDTVPPQRQEDGGRGEDLGQGGEVKDGLEGRAAGRAREDTASAVEDHGRGAGEDAHRDPVVQERLEAGRAGHPTRFCFRAR